MLSERISTLVESVTYVTQQTDVGKVHETAVEAKKIWKMMKDCQEFGLLLNGRQKLFGIEISPLEHLNKLMKEFEPYHSLWTTASGNCAKVGKNFLRVFLLGFSSIKPIVNKIFIFFFISS